MHAPQPCVKVKDGDRIIDKAINTIDKNKNNIVGIKKSEMKFKDYIWYLNEDAEEDNQIVFDQYFKNFTIDNIILSSSHRPTPRIFFSFG